jgi:hypothetical protein
MSINSKRIFSVATASPIGIESEALTFNEILFPSDDEVTELHYSLQEYTDELMDLKIGEGMLQPMRDDLGDMWIYRIK